MFQVGVTGGIGAGKSVVCRVFTLMGVPVYDADSAAKHLMSSNIELMESIRALFGGSAYDSRQNLDRAYVAQKVFHNPDLLTKLNGLIHPKVGEHYAQWVKDQVKKPPYLIKEAALLFEAGSHQQLDSIINVSAPESLRIDRVLMRDPHRDLEQVKAIMGKQWSDEKREEYADATIYNDGKRLIIKQVVQLHRQFLGTKKAEPGM